MTTIRALLGPTREYLEGKGIRFSDGDARTLLSDPETTHGVVFGFTTWSIPNDARPSF